MIGYDAAGHPSWGTERDPEHERDPERDPEWDPEWGYPEYEEYEKEMGWWRHPDYARLPIDYGIAPDGTGDPPPRPVRAAPRPPADPPLPPGYRWRVDRWRVFGCDDACVHTAADLITAVRQVVVGASEFIDPMPPDDNEWAALLWIALHEPDYYTKRGYATQHEVFLFVSIARRDAAAAIAAGIVKITTEKEAEVVAKYRPDHPLVPEFVEQAEQFAAAMRRVGRR